MFENIVLLLIREDILMNDTMRLTIRAASILNVLLNIVMPQIFLRHIKVNFIY